MHNLIVLLLAVAVSTTGACYAAPYAYTGWCNTHRALIGHSAHVVNYCFDVHGEMTLHCEAMASNYPGRGVGGWGAYDIGVINDGDCVRMYWGAVSATPSVRCYSYGTPVNFDIVIK